jgi:hypothetical protein
MRVLIALVALAAMPYAAGVAQGTNPFSDPKNCGTHLNFSAKARRADAALPHGGIHGVMDRPCVTQAPPPPADTQPTPQPPPADTTPTPPPPSSSCPVAAPAVGGTGSIDGSVYQDGTWQLLAGWCIMLSGPVSGVAETNASGRYVFSGLPDGTYTVCEVQQAGWLQTFPTGTAPCQDGWGWSFFVSGGRASFNDFVNRKL